MSSQVVLEFSFPGDGAGEPAVEKRIEISGCPAADVNAVTEVSRTSFTYSGHHDHGDLPVLKSSGPLAELVASLQVAKQKCDEYLTSSIAPPTGEEKRPRLDDGDATSAEDTEMNEG